ncbi:hypothetical protein EDD15DRAFT_2230494 [Pisolithus albus]|nr:hypothetical protein EDD15DRAFT_2230494 [Pisolithus albus]
MRSLTKLIDPAGDGSTGGAYDIFISIGPAPAEVPSSYKEWIVWEPTRPLRVKLPGTDVYPAPCKSWGLRYVASETAFLQASEGAPKDITSLAYLIAKDAGVRGTGRWMGCLRKRAHTSRRRSGDMQGSTSFPSISGGYTELDKGKGRDIDFGMASPEPHLTSEEGDVSMEDDRRDIKDSRRLLAHPRISSNPTAITLNWSAHGIATVMPWTCKKDAMVTAFMAGSRNASEVNHHYQMLLELESRGKPLRKLHLEIRRALAQGTAVLVHGWEPQQATEFSLEDIETYRPPLSQTIKWQDAKERAKLFNTPPSARSYSKQIIEGSLGQFMLAAADPERCLNCLDLPSLVPDIPPFLRGILDDRMALMAFGTEPYVTEKGEATKGNRSGLNDLQLMNFDAWRSRAWDVMTHGGFLTYPHRDATGFLTYSYVQTGAKIWAYIHLDEVDELDSHDVATKWNAYYKYPMATETYNENVIIGTVLLEKGAVLIQPPGVNHMVYTPVPTVMSGGHFLTYETMHLTEMALTLDSELGNEDMQHATDALYPGTLRKVYHMAIALPTLVLARPLFPKRSIIALASIVSTDPRSFSVDKYDEGVRLKVRDALAVEIAGERARALCVMDEVMRRWNITDPWREMRKGLWRDPGPLEDLTFLGSM